MQKALDNILQHYLREETLVTDEEGRVDEELLQSLHKCLQEKGVLKEVHSFLRQRLVAVLQGTWPQLFDHFRTDGQLNPLVLKLVEDFLCSHKLLFTLSVLSTELGDAYTTKVDFSKLASAEAEELLEKFGIEPDTIQSFKILENYAEKGNTSLFEAIINVLPGNQLLGNQEGVKAHYDVRSRKSILTLDERLQKIDDKYLKNETKQQNGKSRVGALSVDQRFRKLALALERDKQIQLQIAIDKFKSEELSRLREEVETEQKFELLRKEKELLANYEEKVNHMKNNLEREKELWLIEKIQKEREIFERREELLLAIQSVREGMQNEKLNAQSESRLSTMKIDIEDIKKEASLAIPNSSAEIKKTWSNHVPSLEERIFEKTTEQREMERAYLLKEAKLRTVIEKLENENQALKSETPFLPPTPTPRTVIQRSAVQSHTSTEELSQKEDSLSQRRQKVKNIDSSSKQRPKVTTSAATVTVETKWRSPVRNHLRSKEYKSGTRHWEKEELSSRASVPDTDTIAFLQYQLECQSEEIDQLRSVMEKERSGTIDSPPNDTRYNSVSKRFSQANYRSPPPVPAHLETSDLDEFLREAKKRISDIEQEAELVEKSLVRMQGRQRVRIPKYSLDEQTKTPSAPLLSTFEDSMFSRINSIPIPEVDIIPNSFKSNVLVAGEIPSIMGRTHQSSLLTSHRHHPQSPSYQHQSLQSLFSRSQIQPRPIQDDLSTFKPRNDQLRRRRRKGSTNDTVNEKSVSETSTSINSNSNVGKTKREIRTEMNEIIVSEGQTIPLSSQKLSSKLEMHVSDGKAKDSLLLRPDKENEYRVDEIMKEKLIPTAPVNLSDMPSSVSLEEKASRSGALVKNKVEASEGNIGAEDTDGNISLPSELSSLAPFSTKPPIKSLEPKIEDGPCTPTSADELGKRTSFFSNPNQINVNSNFVQSKDIQASSIFTPLALPPMTMDLDTLGHLETSKDIELPKEEESFWNM